MEINNELFEKAVIFATKKHAGQSERATSYLTLSILWVLPQFYLK